MHPTTPQAQSELAHLGNKLIGSANAIVDEHSFVRARATVEEVRQELETWHATYGGTYDQPVEQAVAEPTTRRRSAPSV